MNMQKLIVDFEARTARFEKDVAHARKSLDQINKSTSSIKEGFKSARNTVIAFISAYAGIASIRFLARQAKDIIDFGDQLSKANTKLGVSVEWLSQYAHVANLADVELNQFTDSLKKQINFISDAALKGGEGAESLKELGLSAEKLNAMKPEQQFEAIANQLSGLESETDKVRIATDIWSKSGAENLKIINQGTQAIANQKKQAEDLGLVISGQSAKQMEELNDASTLLNGAFKGLGIAFLKEFTVPAIHGIKAIAEAIDTLMPSSANFGVNTLTKMLDDQIKKRDEAALKLKELEAGNYKKNKAYMEFLLAQGDAYDFASDNIEQLEIALENAKKETSAFGLVAKAIDERLKILDGAAQKAAGSVKSFNDAAGAAADTSSDFEKNFMNFNAPELTATFDSQINAPLIPDSMKKNLQLDIDIPDIEAMADKAEAELSDMEKAAIKFNDAMLESSDIIANTALSLSSDLANGFYDALTGAEQFGDVLLEVAMGAVKQLIVSFIELGIQKLIMSKIFKTSETADALVTAGNMELIAIAAAPAAAGVSVATAGASALTGMAALATAYGTANLLAIAHGGLTDVPKEGTYFLQQGERVLSPLQNQDFTRLIESGGFFADTTQQGQAQAIQQDNRVTNNFYPTINIQAPDTQTGAEFVLRHRGVIGNIVSEEIRRSMRH